MNPMIDACTEYMTEILNTCAMQDDFPDDIDHEIAAEIEKLYDVMSEHAAKVQEAIPPEMNEIFLTALSLATLFGTSASRLQESARNKGRRKSRGGRYPECEELAKELYKINPKVTVQVIRFRGVNLGVEVPESDTTIRAMLKRIREEK